MEELKQIAEIINNLGENAKWAFIFWVICDTVIPAICWTTGFITLFVLSFRLGKFGITKTYENRKTLKIQ